MRPLGVGLGLPDSEGMMAGATARWNDLAAYARRGEEIGFDSVWVEDHLLFRFEGKATEGPWECFSMLARKSRNALAKIAPPKRSVR